MSRYFAADGIVSSEPIAGGIEITQAQYLEAIEGMVAGKIVTIDGGFSVSDPPTDPEPEPDPPAPPTADDVIRERERRLAIGFDYDFGDARGMHRIGTTDADMRGWDEVTKVANAMLALGDQTSTIGIVTETGPTQVTALDWQHVLVAAGAFRQPIWAASFALQAMDPIPEDLAADHYWP